MGSVTWQQLNLQTLSPTIFQSVTASIQAIQATQQVVKQAASLNLARARQIIIPYTSFYAASAALQQELLNLVEELARTGVYVAPIPPGEGYYSYLSQQSRNLLAAEWDSEFPDLQDDEDAFLIGIFAASSASAVFKAFRALTDIFLSVVTEKASEEPSAAVAELTPFFTPSSLLEERLALPLVTNAKFVPHWTRERSLRDNNFLRTPSWHSAKVLDLIPGGEETYNNLLTSVQGLTASDPVDPLAQMITEQAANINKIIEDIASLDSLISLMTDAFLDSQVSVLTISPSVGGMTYLRNACANAFLPSAPNFPGANNIELGMAAGVILVGGGATLPSQVFDLVQYVFGLVDQPPGDPG